MHRVCVVLANGFEEIEAVTVIDVLRRAGVEVTMLGVDGAEITGSHGISVKADAVLAEEADRRWDIVILPGGLPGAHTLRDSEAVQALIRRQHAAGGKLAAICAAPIALGKAGVLAGRRATSYPGFESELHGAEVVAEPVVRDRELLTSRGPGTAMEFALALVSDLKGEEEASELRKRMLVGGREARG